MSLCHALASGMGGIRTAGDLVARMQLRKMRLPQAKRYVADRLGIGVDDLTDSTLLRELRAELDIGVITGVPHAAKGIEAKARIAGLLGVPIPSVDRLWAKTARPAGGGAARRGRETASGGPTSPLQREDRDGRSPKEADGHGTT
jgi:dimethylamine--corrinoid protein Co-methyltransferase